MTLNLHFQYQIYYAKKKFKLIIYNFCLKEKLKII